METISPIIYLYKKCPQLTNRHLRIHQAKKGKIMLKLKQCKYLRFSSSFCSSRRSFQKQIKKDSRRSCQVLFRSESHDGSVNSCTERGSWKYYVTVPPNFAIFSL